MPNPPSEPDSTDERLPDGWIRTPISPERRVAREKDNWFGRTGEPAPSRVPVAPVVASEEVEVRRMSQGVVLGATVLIGVFVMLIMGGVGWWFA